MLGIVFLCIVRAVSFELSAIYYPGIIWYSDWLQVIYVGLVEEMCGSFMYVRYAFISSFYRKGNVLIIYVIESHSVMANDAVLKESYIDRLLAL